MLYKIKDFWCQKVLPLVYDDSLSYYEILCKIKSKIDEIIDKINNISNWISGALPTDLHFMNRYGNNIESANDFTFYVSVNGNDNNDGTINSPVKTIKKAMILASKQFKDIRIKILDGGTYDIEWITQTGDLHINTTAKGVVLNLKKNFINYSSHLNISGSANDNIVINGNGFQFYCDNCLCTFDYCELNCDFRLYGSSATFTRTILHNLTVLGGYATFNIGTVFKNTVVNRSALFLTNSIVYFSADWKIELEENDNHNFLQVFGGQIVCSLAPIIVNEGNVYEQNIMNLCVFITNNTAYNALKTLVNKNDFRESIISNINLN